MSLLSSTFAKQLSVLLRYALWLHNGCARLRGAFFLFLMADVTKKAAKMVQSLPSNLTCQPGMQFSLTRLQSIARACVAAVSLMCHLFVMSFVIHLSRVCDSQAGVGFGSMHH